MPCHAHVHAHVKKAWCHKKAVRCRRNDRRFAAGMACLCYGIPQHLHQMAASPFHSQFGGDSPPPNGDAEKVDDILLLVWRLPLAFPPLADDTRSQPRCCALSLLILRFLMDIDASSPKPMT